ncbi:polysaccharide deacetylase family protein [Alexandriicola marinus]|uniref:polysaccharide deacetylase family protein n=1 Tax=Alexandriicola marinus TaxID=2081710 RepID=UPI001EED8923
MIDRRMFLAGLPLAVSGCGAPSVWADQEFVQSKVYRHPGPTALTLFTMKNVGTENGAHTGLMVSASQRVIFDPAGTFGHETIPERNDVHFGITPRILDFYRTYHARETYFVIEQYVEVTPEQAEQALRLVIENGPVPKAQCTRSTSSILMRISGFEGRFRPSLFPNGLHDQFAKLPNVVTFEHREYDSADKSEAVRAFDAQLSAEASVSSSQ